MSEPVLSVSHLSKKYSRRLRPSLTNAVRDFGRELWPAAKEAGLRSDEYWALNDISFELRPGEAIGIVGRNGAGKSSLLKLLYGLIKPDRGEIIIRGRTEALIELGTGFNGMLSGRENILLGAVLHGFDARRSRLLLDEVIDFAELGELIDAPVQTYSSGMRARIAYAIAAQLKPDLLLVDEVLAVGDHRFQRKCLNHMRSYLDQGGSLLFVSHNVFQVQSICQRGLLLDEGRGVFEGSAVATLDRMFDQRASEAASPRLPAAFPNQSVDINSVTIEAMEGGPLRSGGAARITLACAVHERSIATWHFSIWSMDLWVCITGASQPGNVTIEPGAHVFDCLIPRLPLVAGRFALRAAVVDSATGVPLAIHGWSNAPTNVEVVDEPSSETITRHALQQMVSIDVDWG